MKNPMDIAIVGLGAMYPGRGDTLGFWRDIVEGVDTLSDVPASHWLPEDYYDDNPKAPDKTYGRRGGFLSPQVFDPVAMGVPPNVLETTDSSQLLAMVAAEKVLGELEADTGGVIDKATTSVVLGVASATELTAHMAGRLGRPTWIKAMREAGLEESRVQEIAGAISSNFAEWKESTFPGLLGNVIAGRIANRFDLGGSNYVTDAACASSLSAVQVAIHELSAGDSSLVIAGGVDTLNDILMFMCFSKTPALSPTGDCRPFSANADGTMLGEGIGLIALRRLEDAERDGNRIHAVIKGLGGGSDGKGTAIYAPLSSGQARALRRAYEKAGYGPETVTLVEGHGTGTVAGDAAEIGGLMQVFHPDGGPVDKRTAIGSIKSQIGHTKAAAGAASLIKTAFALSQKTLPPTLKVTAPAPALDGDTPFYLNTKARPWIAGKATPRRAAVSSFGFGGSNFHLTLEEYTGPNAAPALRQHAAELVLVSAPTDAALSTELDRLASELGEDDGALARLADTSHAAFNTGDNARLAITATDADDFRTKIARLKSLLSTGQIASAPLPAGVSYGTGAAPGGKVAFLFPGQGSQYVGMGADLALAFPEARAAWDRAASHKSLGSLDLHNVAFPPEPFSDADAEAQTARLTEMHHAQPALAVSSTAVLSLLSKAGIAPDLTAGHSFGELSALHAAGAISEKTLFTLARTRAEAMTEAAKGSDGAMLAVQASAEAIAPKIAHHADIVIANDNGPTQIALSGPTSAIEAVAAELTAASIKARRLPVASAFHSKIVASASETFAKALGKAKFDPPAVPVYANTTAKRYPRAVDAARKRLAGQIAAPVKFRELIERMYEDGARTFVEVGAGRIVSNIAGQILEGRPATIVSLNRKGANGLFTFLSGLGALASAGHTLDVAALYADMPAPPEPKPRPKYAVEISGANYKKPYPPAEGAAALPQPNAVDAKAAPPPTIAAEPTISVSPTRTPTSPPKPQDPIPKEPAPVTQDPAQTSALFAIYQDMAARHSEFMTAQAQAHAAFMNMAAAMLGQAQQFPAVVPAPTVSAPPVSAPVPMPVAAPVAAPAPAPMPAPVPVAAAAPAPIPAAPAPITSAPVTPPPTVVATPAPVAAPAPAPAPAPANGSADPTAWITDIVAERTGYPADMLDPNMDLEGELGVDSIKQVEILSAVRETMPHLPEIAPDQLATLRTIGQIAGFLGAAPATNGHAPAPATNGAGAPAMNGHANGHAAPNGANGAANGGMADLVRSLIADKTGYPTDMLEDDMDLEGELGVDSIKQVEILSALREQMPNLPEVDPTELAQLRTIRKIADFFG